MIIFIIFVISVILVIVVIGAILVILAIYFCFLVLIVILIILDILVNLVILAFLSFCIPVFCSLYLIFALTSEILDNGTSFEKHQSLNARTIFPNPSKVILNTITSQPTSADVVSGTLA